MKKSIIILFIMSCFSLAAQENKFYAGLYFSPDICDRVIIKGEAKSINDLTIWHLRFHSGIAAGYQLTKSFYFESGFQYTSKGVDIGRIPVIDMEGNPTGDEVSARQNAGYIGIPLKVKFMKLTKRVFFTASGGIIPNVLVNSIVVNTLYGDVTQVYKDKPLGDYRHFTITSVISAGLGIAITKNTSIQLEPAFQFDLISDYPKSNGHYWNLGLKAGFFRRF